MDRDDTINRPFDATDIPGFVAGATGHIATVDRDYSMCEVTGDKHVPAIALVQDAELIPLGYVTLECTACHQTTGYPVDFPDSDITW